MDKIILEQLLKHRALLWTTILHENLGPLTLQLSEFIPYDGLMII